MKRWFALLLVLIVMHTTTAYAAKARSIATDTDSKYHSNHLSRHIGESICHATGNYIKTRSQSNKNRVIGHLEQADTFCLLALEDGYALIQVITSHKTSPDSWNGMTGWVNSDYIDCLCSSEEYISHSVSNTRTNNPAKFKDFIGTTSVVATVNKLCVRNEPNGKILGRIGKADEFILLTVQNGWAQITVTKPASSSSDSWKGLSGWISTEYIQIRENAHMSPTIGAGYDSVLEFFYRAISEKWDNDRIWAADFEPWEFPNDLNESGFVYWDINDDGIEELFVFNVPDTPIVATPLYNVDPILAGYTLVNGYPVRIFSSWARNRHYLRTDGSIYNEGSNGASHSVYYIYDFIDSKLDVREGVLSGDYEEHGETKYGWFLVDERADFSYAEHDRLSDEEAMQRIALYQSSIVYQFDDFTTFAEYEHSHVLGQ